MAIFKLSPNVQLQQQTEERQVSIPVGCVPSAFMVLEGMVPERGYGGTTLPPPMNRQTRVKTLPSRNFVSGW